MIPLQALPNYLVIFVIIVLVLILTCLTFNHALTIVDPSDNRKATKDPSIN